MATLAGVDLAGAHEAAQSRGIGLSRTNIMKNHSEKSKTERTTRSQSNDGRSYFASANDGGDVEKGNHVVAADQEGSERVVSVAGNFRGGTQ